METVIECRNLTHYYGDRCIYEDLNFSIPKGRIVGLLGKNGTGKTTTINILNGYLQPRSGQCLMLGHKAGQLPPSVKKKNSAAFRRSCAIFVHEHPANRKVLFGILPPME
jgi:ABC-2 type transport system ATP-binding protein